MAPSRKSRSVNKRFSYVNEVATNNSKNAVESPSKSRTRKRKLSDMLGPQWAKDELERFYKAYRKHGKDWEKVSAAVRNRSVEMVEALYTMNKAYLSLPKGYASATGLIAMMTDHYSNMGDSDSDQEINEEQGVSRKPQKRARGTRGSDEPPVPDLLHSQPAVSNYGCLSLLKKRRSGSRPWAVGKRTPRVPVAYSVDKDTEDRYMSPIRRGLKLRVDAIDDDVAHEIAIALAEASQRGSPQVSQRPDRKIETSSPAQNIHKMRESDMSSAKLRGNEVDEDGCELSLGSTGADIGDSTREKNLSKGKRYRFRKPEVEESMDNHSDDVKEACSGTEEGQKLRSKGKLKLDIPDTKLVKSSSKGSRKRSKKVLFGEGEEADFEALQALADLSLRLPETPVDTGSSVYAEEEKTETIAKPKPKGNHLTSGPKTKQGKAFPPNISSSPETKEEAHHFNSATRKRRQKALPSKISENVDDTESLLGESKKMEFQAKGKRSHDSAHAKQGKLMKPAEYTASSNDHGRESNDSAPSAVQVLSASQFNLPTKVRSRRKINTPKPLLEKDTKTAENNFIGQSNISIPSFHDRALNLKEKLSNCLNWDQVRRWCVFEWFYSAIDYPWFAKREFVEYLEHVGLGHIPRLTRVEWGVIRSSLGKPRRFSEQFLKEEKEKLYQYRESVRNHYTELRAGTRDGLPTDLAKPLAVGQRIIAIHPRTREIHDGSVLTVDHDRCRVQFDNPELGVEFVMDVDCMPMNPLENMPASLTRHNVALSRYIDDLNELKLNGQSVDRMEGYLKFSPHENLDKSNALLHTSPPAHQSGNLLQTKGGTASTNAQVGMGLEEAVTQQACKVQPTVIAQFQAKEADVRALSELTRALDKKEVVMSELKRMNDEVLEDQKDRGNSLKDSETFKKHYAAVLLQLNEVNEQACVASDYFTISVDPSGDDSLESGSHVSEIVETSRTKAQTMVDAAMQAISSLKNEGNSIQNIQEAIDFVNNQLSVDDFSAAAVRSSTPASSTHGTMASHDQLNSTAADTGTINHAPDIKLDNLPSQDEAQIPSDLIAQCVATLLMIQKCTERQFPPSDVAQVLDSAVTSLKPCCSQNLPIYAEIQKCMGIIRNQLLALIPT
ncbi:hypothetical protein Tsubulata_049839 [Turnera subulata]|uniref:SANT domain-containing protein n=1 Tax=Turnera subulata TaxID=218843 RepID=A0A9Q0GH82_9ROSI|nr:hypothetical protein Tsubulata_049839 [Turnera subulata]